LRERRVLVELQQSEKGAAPYADVESDAALAMRLRAGDVQAFDTLVRRYRGCLVATARRVLGNDHDAQDAVQEAFSSAFMSIGSFRGDASISTWLHRIVINAALMQLRRRRRCAEVAIDDLPPPFEAQTCAARTAELPDRASENWGEAREKRAVLKRGIDQLRPIYRSVFWLRDIEDLSISEVAAKLKLNANTVKIRLHRARQALKSILDREGLGEDYDRVQGNPAR
jgi:RNA polymerase sigma-70 factor (ECF subfamily)